MNGFSFVRNGLLTLVLASAPLAWSAMPTNPVSDAQFTVLPSGLDLRTVSVNGSRLSLTRGEGNTFSASARAKYEKIKADSQANPNARLQWVLMDLDSHQVIQQSANPDLKIFGASSSKIFVGATLLNKQNGALSKSQVQLMANMLVVSSNEAWTSLQAQIGDGDSNKGRELNYAFTQGMGYKNTRGFQGYWGKLHGNELTAMDTAEFLHDTYKGEYVGAETLFKMMHFCRTGSSKAEKYIPSSIYVGGKTGTYGGETEDPYTGKSINVDVRNHMIVFNVANHEYALTILADTGTDETAALLAGGLLRDYTGYQGR